MARREAEHLYAVGLALVGALAAVRTCAAQDLHLTVCPRVAATALRTERAGRFLLGNVGVYVPPQCVGVQRCPLVLHSNAGFDLLLQMADKYGLIAADIDAIMPRQEIRSHEDSVAAAAAVASLDSTLKVALRTFAIDPDKIAIVGGSATGETTVTYAAQNQDVFSRVLVYTQHTGDPPVKSPARAVEYYISGGLLESSIYLWARRVVQDRGYPVKYTIQLRRHGPQYEDYDFMARWLTESWTIPNPTARPAPYVFGEPQTLTPTIVAKLTAFWARFQQEPDSIRTDARRAYVREVVVPVDEERISTLMVDMPALAARYPTVARDLEAAGLTAREHDVYRAALYSARVAWATTVQFVVDEAKDPLGFSPQIKRVGLPTYIRQGSVVAKNLAFMDAHADAFAALEETQMWETP